MTILGGTNILSEIESAEILRKFGVTMVESRRVTSEEDALHAAQAFGYPVVLKALPSGVAHKSKLGLVITGLHDDASLKAGYARLASRLHAQGFATANVTVIAQPMVPAKAEIIIGVTTEAPFGHFLLAGLGGVYTEVLDDIVLLPVPIADETIRKRLAAATVGRLICQAGGENALSQVVRALAALQRLVLAYSNEVISIDVNPLVLTEGGALAVDALIVLK